MYFPITKTCLDGVFKFSMVVEKVLNSSVVKTYGATSFSIFPSLRRFVIDHKCSLIPLCCKSHLTFTLSFSPITIFRIFFVKFCSQCITSNLNQIKSSCTNHKHLQHFKTIVDYSPHRIDINFAKVGLNITQHVSHEP